AGLQHELLPVDDVEPFPLQGEHDGRLDDVEADRVVYQAGLLQLHFDLVCDIFSPARFRTDSTAEIGDARPRPGVKPWAIDLMVPGRRTDIPNDGLAVLHQQRPAHELVIAPGP